MSMNRAVRRRAKRTGAAERPPDVRCPACNVPCHADWFDTREMAAMLPHPIASGGWKYLCPLCQWRGHIVGGVSPLDDVWMQAQLHLQQGHAVEIALMVTRPGMAPEKVFSVGGDPKVRASGIVVAV